MSKINSVNFLQKIGSDTRGQYCSRQRELETREHFFVAKVMQQANGLYGVLCSMDFMPLAEYPDTWNLTYNEACDVMSMFIEAQK